MICPHCNKELPEWMYYDDVNDICRMVVMK